MKFKKYMKVAQIKMHKFVKEFLEKLYTKHKKCAII